MPHTKAPYPPAFRREAVELVLVSSRPIGTLRNWVKQADVDLTPEEREELGRLRRETT